MGSQPIMEEEMRLGDERSACFLLVESSAVNQGTFHSKEDHVDRRSRTIIRTFQGNAFDATFVLSS